MGTIHLRDVEDTVVYQLRIRAAQLRTTVKKLVLDAIAQSMGGEPRKEVASEDAGKRQQRREELVLAGSPKPVRESDSHTSSAAMPTHPKPKTDPANIPGVKRGKHFTDTW